MTDSEAVRRVALALPRAHEQEVRGIAKLKVRQIVFVAFAEDERSMGFGYPRDERDGLVASAPQVFFLPPQRDLRYQWVCARLPALAEGEMRELVVDAWRLCVPAMLHDLPELEWPAARAWNLLDQRDWVGVRPLLHPYLHFRDGPVLLRGRSSVLRYLAERPTPRPPAEVEVRDGQIYRWTREGTARRNY